MLLSAPRSLLLLPPAPPPGEKGAEGRSPAQNLALLRAAAERLRVPMVSEQSRSWRLGLASGRTQLVAATALAAMAELALPPGTAVFQVLDCLAVEQRPPESAWPTLEATPVTTEMVVFEWLERGATEDFRALIAHIK